MNPNFIGRAAAIVLAVCLMGPAALASYSTIVNHGPNANRVNIVFVGDGYTASEIGTTYLQHVNTMVNHMFGGTQNPFPRYANYFNVHAVNVISNESGADIPPDGIFRDTALDASFYWNGSTTERLLYLNDTKANTAVANALSGTGITADMKLATVNTTKYGGGGGQWAVAAGGNASAAEIALHELGHSFSNLADEYVTIQQAFPQGEPNHVNVTKDPSGAKWAHWAGYTDPQLPGMTIGVFEGAEQYATGIYRPSSDSKMRSLGRPFDAVSREKIILDIYDIVSPLDTWLSNVGTLIDPQNLWVDVIDPNVIKVDWYVNGELLNLAIGQTLDLIGLGYGAGDYQVKALAYDDTEWVRSNRNLLERSVEWSVTLTIPEPTTAWLVMVTLLAGTHRSRRRLAIAA